MKTFKKVLASALAAAMVVTAFPVVNQTQQAILEKYGEEANSITITSKVPFSSATKWSAVTTDSGKSYYLGAPEILYSTKYDEIKETFITEMNQSVFRYYHSDVCDSKLYKLLYLLYIQMYVCPVIKQNICKTIKYNYIYKIEKYD